MNWYFIRLLSVKMRLWTKEYTINDSDLGSIILKEVIKLIYGVRVVICEHPRRKYRLNFTQPSTPPPPTLSTFPPYSLCHAPPGAYHIIFFFSKSQLGANYIH
jgi:hypothetical protein